MAGTLFGAELRRLRRQARKSLADLADAIGCSITFISEVERGNKNPPGSTAIKKLLAAVGAESEHLRMLTLAARSRKAVEISVEDKPDDVASMLVALARRCDEGKITEEMAEKIRKLLEKGETQ